MSIAVYHSAHYNTVDTMGTITNAIIQRCDGNAKIFAQDILLYDQRRSRETSLAHIAIMFNGGAEHRNKTYFVSSWDVFRCAAPLNPPPHH